jgi:hypothetical protein
MIKVQMSGEKRCFFASQLHLRSDGKFLKTLVFYEASAQIQQSGFKNFQDTGFQALHT